MNALLQPQQDFFLYVPTVRDELVSREQRAGKTSFKPDIANLPGRNASWIEVPLAESLVVYACLWNEQGTYQKAAAGKCRHGGK